MSGERAWGLVVFQVITKVLGLRSGAEHSSSVLFCSVMSSLLDFEVVVKSSPIINPEFSVYIFFSSEVLFRDMADRLAEDGWRELGYVYINIDDCWALKTRDEHGRLQADPKRHCTLLHRIIFKIIRLLANLIMCRFGNY